MIKEWLTYKIILYVEQKDVDLLCNLCLVVFKIYRFYLLYRIENIISSMLTGLSKLTEHGDTINLVAAELVDSMKTIVNVINKWLKTKFAGNVKYQCAHISNMKFPFNLFLINHKMGLCSYLLCTYFWKLYFISNR